MVKGGRGAQKSLKGLAQCTGSPDGGLGLPRCLLDHIQICGHGGLIVCAIEIAVALQKIISR